MAEIVFSVDSRGELEIEGENLNCNVNTAVTFRNSDSNHRVSVKFDNESRLNLELSPSSEQEMNVGSTPGSYRYTAIAVPAETMRDPVKKSKTADIHVNG